MSFLTLIIIIIINSFIKLMAFLPRSHFLSYVFFLHKENATIRTSWYDLCCVQCTVLSIRCSHVCDDGFSEKMPQFGSRSWSWYLLFGCWIFYIRFTMMSLFFILWQNNRAPLWCCRFTIPFHSQEHLVIDVWKRISWWRTTYDDHFFQFPSNYLYIK